MTVTLVDRRSFVRYVHKTPALLKKGASITVINNDIDTHPMNSVNISNAIMNDTRLQFSCVVFFCIIFPPQLLHNLQQQKQKPTMGMKMMNSRPRPTQMTVPMKYEMS